MVNYKDIGLAAVMSLLWVGLSGIYLYKGNNLILLAIAQAEVDKTQGDPIGNFFRNLWAFINSLEWHEDVI